MAKKWEAIIINGKDNVATALKALQTGAQVSVDAQDSIRTVTILSDVPLGHKFAVEDMDEGDLVIKYGEPIGRSTTRIAAGEHVHVHNLVSQPKGNLS